jgi:VacB/RNase II family 3'-5' exoribonuclease
MKSLIDRDGALSRGLADIRTQFEVPSGYPAGVMAEAEQAAARPITEHADWTGKAFATLDPAASTDLDQAFCIERAGAELILHYAIADVAWFVAGGGALDTEAWGRGETIYMPDGKASLYPEVLSQGAASLLPDVDRPSVVFSVRIDPAGKASLDGATRAIIRSRAKLAYETVQPDDLSADFGELARRIEQAEDERGANRVDAPEQELVVGESGHFSLRFRPQAEAERQNAALSLAANLAIADALFAHRTGLFRVMGEPPEWMVKRLRHTAKALGLHWSHEASLKDFERTLDSSHPRHVAFQAAVRRAGPKASYAPYQDQVVPWHSAMAATYAHATAPLRRLADRYVIEATVRVANGMTVPDELNAIFQRLPAVMDKAEEKAGQIDRAVLDLAEAVVLEGRKGSRFDAVVTDIDERGARIQLCDPAVIARINANGMVPGDDISVELANVDVAQRRVEFRRV